MEYPSHGIHQTKCHSKNLLTCINNCRQLGYSSPRQFHSDLLKHKVRDLRCTRMSLVKLPRFEMSQNQNRPFACTFVSPAFGSFACSWIAGDYPRQCVFVGLLDEGQGKEITSKQRSDFDYPIYSHETKFNYVFKNHYLVDIALMDDNVTHLDAFFIVSQQMHDSLLRNGSISNIEMVPKSSDIAQMSLFPKTSVHVMCKVCNIVWNSNTQKLSLGTDSGIIFTTCDSLFAQCGEIFCPGEVQERFSRPYAQRFHPSGNLLYFGFDDGYLTCLDLRCARTRFQSDMMIGDGITSLQFLRDNVTLIAGGANDKLCCVDTRMKSVLFDYPGHRTNDHKTTFAFDESFGILCSSGGDHVTRYWDLKHGDFLGGVASDFPGEKGLYIYSTVQSSGNKLYSYTFCGEKIRYMESVS